MSLVGSLYGEYTELAGMVRSPSDCHVLVVDDDAAIRELVVEVLTREGYPVVSARDGRAALEEVARRAPDVILLDMRMPRLDGWGFARALSDRGIQIPLIVMTAAQNSTKWAAEVGADRCLAKPFDLSDLVAAVAGLCGA